MTWSEGKPIKDESKKDPIFALPCVKHDIEPFSWIVDLKRMVTDNTTKLCSAVLMLYFEEPFQLVNINCNFTFKKINVVCQGSMNIMETAKKFISKFQNTSLRGDVIQRQCNVFSGLLLQETCIITTRFETPIATKYLDVKYKSGISRQLLPSLIQILFQTYNEYTPIADL